MTCSRVQDRFDCDQGWASSECRAVAAAALMGFASGLAIAH